MRLEILPILLHGAAGDSSGTWKFRVANWNSGRLYASFESRYGLEEGFGRVCQG